MTVVFNSFGGHFILTFSNGRKEVIDTGRVYNENLYLVKIDPNDNSVDKMSDDMDKASIGIMDGSIFKEIDELLNKLKKLSTKDDKLKIYWGIKKVKKYFYHIWWNMLSL